MAKSLAGNKTIDNMRKAIHAFNQRFSVAYKQEVARYREQGITTNPLETSPILIGYQNAIKDINSKTTGILKIDPSRGILKESKHNLEVLTNGYLQGMAHRGNAVRDITSTLKEVTTVKIVTDIYSSAEDRPLVGTSPYEIRKNIEKQVKASISKRGKKAFNKQIADIEEVFKFTQHRNAVIERMFTYYPDSDAVYTIMKEIAFNPTTDAKEWERLTGRTLDIDNSKDIIDFTDWLIAGKPDDTGKLTGTPLKDMGMTVEQFMEKYKNAGTVDYYYGSDDGMEMSL